jgi:hypothetical protein
MRTPGKFLLVEPIKQHYVPQEYAHTFAMPIGFSKPINLNQTEHQVEATYDMPFLLPCLLIDTLQLERRPIKQSNRTRLCVPFLSLLALNFTLDKN